MVPSHLAQIHLLQTLESCVKTGKRFYKVGKLYKEELEGAGEMAQHLALSALPEDLVSFPASVWQLTDHLQSLRSWCLLA